VATPCRLLHFRCVLFLCGCVSGSVCVHFNMIVYGQARLSGLFLDEAGAMWLLNVAWFVSGVCCSCEAV